MVTPLPAIVPPLQVSSPVEVIAAPVPPSVPPERLIAVKVRSLELKFAAPALMFSGPPPILVTGVLKFTVAPSKVLAPVTL